MTDHLGYNTPILGVAYVDVAVRRIGEGREQEQQLCKLGNSFAAPHREVPVPQRQDVEERPCVPRLDLDHFASQSDSPRLDQRLPYV